MQTELTNDRPITTGFPRKPENWKSFMCNNLGKSTLFASSELAKIAFSVAPEIPLLVVRILFKLEVGAIDSTASGSDAPSGLLSSTSDEEDMFPTRP